MASPTDNSAAGESLDLLEIVRSIWAGKWVIALVVITMTTGSVLVSMVLPNVYQPEVLLAPRQEDKPSLLSSLSGEYRGLASFAGLDIGSQGSSRVDVGLAVLNSRKFVGDFIVRNELLIPLIAARRWDPETGTLLLDPDIYDEESDQWIREPNPPRGREPSQQEAYEEFVERLTILQDVESGLVRIRFEHESPEFARFVLDRLVQDLNRFIMEDEVEEAQQAISFLEQQLTVTSLSELKAVFFRLIEENTKVVVLSKASDEYFFRVIDPPVAPELKSGPNRKLIIALTFLLTFLIASSAWLTYTYLGPAATNSAR